jgi:heme oxygenase
MISSKLNIPDDTGFSFFNGYKEHTDIMWEKFKTILNAQAANSTTEESMVEAANQTFIKFKEWINEHQ